MRPAEQLGVRAPIGANSLSPRLSAAVLTHLPPGFCSCCVRHPRPHTRPTVSNMERTCESRPQEQPPISSQVELTGAYTNFRWDTMNSSDRDLSQSEQWTLYFLQLSAFYRSHPPEVFQENLTTVPYRSTCTSSTSHERLKSDSYESLSVLGT